MQPEHLMVMLLVVEEQYDSQKVSDTRDKAEELLKAMQSYICAENVRCANSRVKGSGRRDY